MKRSTHVAAPLLAAAALAITTGCEKPQMQRCVDQNNKVVDDSFCANLPPATQNQQNQNLGGPGYFPYLPYHYYYGGWGGYGLGTLVGGGSYYPDPAPQLAGIIARSHHHPRRLRPLLRRWRRRRRQPRQFRRMNNSGE